MPTYIRFQTDLCDRDACQGLGVFQAVGLLVEQELVETCFNTPLRDVLLWFNRNLQVPRIPEQHRRCVFWFCTDDHFLVNRLWDLVAILREHDIEVRKLRTTAPGIIVYRDDYQIAAIPNRRIKYALRV